MDLHALTRRAAKKYGVPPKVLEALIQQESGYQTTISSPAGAQDIAQFMPATAKAYGVRLGDNDPRDDLDGAAHYMADNLKRTGGNVKQALSIYNSGRPDGYLSIPETKNYVSTIMANAGKMPGGGGTGAAGGTGVTGISLNRGSTKISVTDPALARRQFFAEWMAKQNPNSPLLKLGVLDPNMSTKTTVKIPKVTGFEITEGRTTKGKGASLNHLRPGGKYAGTAKLLAPFEDVAGGIGLTKTSGKRATVNTASGNVSDHFEGNKLADAGDFGGPVNKMDAYAKRLQEELGFRDWKGVQNVTKQIGDHVYRFQMLYRTNVGGDHFNHVHLGIKRVS